MKSNQEKIEEYFEKKGIIEVHKGHYHEIADRGFMIMDLIYDRLFEHPGMTEEENKLCEEAINKIYRIVNTASGREEDWDSLCKCGACGCMVSPKTIFLKTGECIDCENKSYRYNSIKCNHCDQPIPCNFECEKNEKVS